MEVVALSFQLAVQLFAETILVEAKGCQGSTQLILERVVIDFPLRHVKHLEHPRVAIADNSWGVEVKKRCRRSTAQAATAQYTAVAHQLFAPWYRPHLSI